MVANERQVGGAHYKSEYQHWDFAVQHFGSGYLQGVLTKYVTRWKNKNGVQDLEKAMHYLEKLEEVGGVYPRSLNVYNDVTQFCVDNELGAKEAMIIHSVIVGDFALARTALLSLTEMAKAVEPTGHYVDQS